MIPKVIHYCWFGGNELPEDAKKCISSWKKFFPDYEIKQWNESNYDVEKCEYIKEAYQRKKWAFVSDYARFDILYQYGGIYFDTDVEVIKPMDDIIEKGSFVGMESGTIEGLRAVSENYQNSVIENLSNYVAPGLGMGAVSGLPLLKKIVEGYNKRHFLKENGDIDTNTVCHYTTDFLVKGGVAIKDGLGFSEGVLIYPKDYFCPKDYSTGEIQITPNTRSIHHYDATWITPIQKKIHAIEKKYIAKYGEDIGKKKAKRMTLVYRIINKFQTRGIKCIFKGLFDKIK